MSDQPRELPEQPNLRFLKLEAKRRLTAGEFATLAAVPPDTIIDMLVKAAAVFREDLVVIEEPTGRSVRAQVGGLRVEAFAEADPPHRLTSLLLYRLSQLVTDERVAAPSTVTAGQVPAEAMTVAGHHRHRGAAAGGRGAPRA
jgi:hypothetical protein